MRLVDADSICKHAKIVQELDKTKVIAMYYRAVDTRDIMAMPTIDPVRHGAWIDVRAASGIAIDCKCSECGAVAVNWYEKTPYCPECGAKMDRRNKNEW